MDSNEVLEQHRTSTIAYMRNQVAALECEIVRCGNDIKYWTDAVALFSDPLYAQMLECLKSMLEIASRDREYYRARIARYEGFDMVRSDVH